LDHNLKIDSIGFNIAEFSGYTSSRELRNFSVKVMECDCTQINYSFMDTKSVLPVFYEDQYILPARKGWLFLDINDIFYSGTKPLLLELSWGINTFSSSYYDAFSVYTHETDENCVAYGYNDFKELPDLLNCSKFRPDIYLAGKKVDLFQVKITISENVYPRGQDTLYLKIGEKCMNVVRYDSLQVELPADEFGYLLFKDPDGVELLSGKFNVSPTTEYIEIGNTNQTLRISGNNDEVKCYISHGQLNIELPDGYNHVSLFLVDLSGRILFMDKFASTHYNKILPVADGIYLIYMLTDEDELIYYDKIVSHNPD
jgi:hypothetical protein